jgi:hypothetical protein
VLVRQIKPVRGIVKLLELFKTFIEVVLRTVPIFQALGNSKM